MIMMMMKKSTSKLKHQHHHECLSEGGLYGVYRAFMGYKLCDALQVYAIQQVVRVSVMVTRCYIAGDCQLLLVCMYSMYYTQLHLLHMLCDEVGYALQSGVEGEYNLSLYDGDMWGMSGS